MNKKLSRPRSATFSEWVLPPRRNDKIVPHGARSAVIALSMRRLDAGVLDRAISDQWTADLIMGDFGDDPGSAGYRKGLEFYEKTHNSQLSRTMAIRMVSKGEGLLVNS